MIIIIKLLKKNNAIAISDYSTHYLQAEETELKKNNNGKCYSISEY